MSERKIADYVEKNLKKGIEINDIKKALSKAGWSKSEIENGINLLNDKPSDPNFRNKDYSKYLSDDKKRNKKVIIFFALVLMVLIVLGYFFFPRYELDIEKSIKNQDETIATHESENEETSQTEQELENDIETQNEDLTEESSEQEEEAKTDECVEKYYKMCYFGDVYWYDSCYNIGEIATKCPSGECINATCVECKQKAYQECYDDDLYWYDSCRRMGAKAKECEFGCIGDSCLDEEES